MLKTLTYREREVIKLPHGIGDGYTDTLEEGGTTFKAKREGVRQVEAKAIRQLQYPVRARKLELHWKTGPDVELPAHRSDSWRAPSLEKMLSEFAQVFPNEIENIDPKQRRERAFDAIVRCHKMKCLGAFVGFPITIRTIGDGQSATVPVHVASS